HGPDTSTASAPGVARFHAIDCTRRSARFAILAPARSDSASTATRELRAFYLPEFPTSGERPFLESALCCDTGRDECRLPAGCRQFPRARQWQLPRCGHRWSTPPTMPGLRSGNRRSQFSRRLRARSDDAEVLLAPDADVQGCTLTPG